MITSGRPVSSLSSVRGGKHGGMLRDGSAGPASYRRQGTTKQAVT